MAGGIHIAVADSRRDLRERAGARAGGGGISRKREDTETE